MQNEPINTAPIHTFINQVKAADLSNQREIKMDLKTAKALSFCLTQVLAKNIQDYEALLKNFGKTEETITVKLDGGGL
jgi:hypothetical protein